MLADLFEDFRNMCLEIYEIDPAHYLPAPGLSWQVSSRETKIKLDLLAYIDMLLIVEKSIGGVMCHAIDRYVKARNKYMKNCNENEESLFLKYLDLINLYGSIKSR